MVGLDVHLKKIKSLLEMDRDCVKIVGISGPAGIGKSTIVRALHTQLTSFFPRSCFMDNLRGHYNSGSDEYTSKLGLQGQLLSEILNQKCMTIGNLDMVKYWLHDQKVLIILDDVTCLDQLEALVDEEWFGHGSRVIVTTENKEILEQHGITNIYHVGFPSEREALMIFCQSAFRQISPPDEFKNLAKKVASICGNLPLGLKVLGSSMRGKSKDKWMDELPRLKKCLDRRIESVLKVGYESLDEEDQELFLFIAVFFNNKDVDHMTSMLAKSNLNVHLGLEKLANRCLIFYINGHIVMHHLLQVMATKVISEQEDWKRKILADAQQICNVLENGKVNGSIVGISFDVSEINKLKLSRKAFEGMYNLLFLEVYNGFHSNKKVKLHIPEELDFLPSVRLLRWDAYPRKNLPSRFCPKNLIELDMSHSQLKKLWEGTQLLPNLKKMELSWSERLKELPDLSNATNLETLNLMGCPALVKLPSSFPNLHKLLKLNMWRCKSLEIIPNLANLTSLQAISMMDCSQLRNFPESIRHCSRLEFVSLVGCTNLKTLTSVPTSIRRLFLAKSGIERITDCLKHLHRLDELVLSFCKRLVSLPELPCSLKYLKADDCESLERVSGPLNTPFETLYFNNCFKLDGQSRQAIIQRSIVKGFTLLPGREVPAEFDYRARGDSLTIPHSDFNRFKVCVVLSPFKARPNTLVNPFDEDTNEENDIIYFDVPYSPIGEGLRSEHLLIFHDRLPFMDPSKVRRNIVLQIKNDDARYFHITECGIQILRVKTNRNNDEEAYGNDIMRRMRFLQSDEEEKSSDKEDYKSESCEPSDRKDEEDGYKSRTKQASNFEYEGIADKSVRRKRSRKTKVMTNLKWGIQKLCFLRK